MEVEEEVERVAQNGGAGPGVVTITLVMKPLQFNGQHNDKPKD